MIRVFFAVGLSLLANAGDIYGQQSVDERRAAGRDGTVKISVPAGTVRLIGWSHDSIAVTGAMSDGAQLEFATAKRESTVRVLVPRGETIPSSADLEISVPRSSHVAIRTVTAGVDVSGVDGAIDVESQAGNVTAIGDLRTVYAETAGGDIRLDVSTKVLRAKSVNGSITVQGARGYVEISTVSGDATLNARRLWEGEISTVSGNITFDGEFDHPGSLIVESHGGTIVLRLDPRINADFDLVNVKGSVENDFAAAGERTFSSGRGGTQIKLKSFKGGVRVTKRP